MDDNATAPIIRLIALILTQIWCALYRCILFPALLGIRPTILDDATSLPPNLFQECVFLTAPQCIQLLAVLLFNRLAGEGVYLPVSPPTKNQMPSSFWKIRFHTFQSIKIPVLWQLVLMRSFAYAWTENDLVCRFVNRKLGFPKCLCLRHFPAISFGLFLCQDFFSTFLGLFETKKGRICIQVPPRKIISSK